MKPPSLKLSLLTSKKGSKDINTICADLEREWDIIIIGGGITGAGIFRMASKYGIKTLLLEKNDFAFGTSSRSSKMVHGGLRYLKNYQFNVTRESVIQREKLMRDAKFLVNPLMFLFPVYDKYRTSPGQIGFSLFLYDLFAKKIAHGKVSKEEVYKKAPNLLCNGLISAFYYYDAIVDDARLVYRNIQEGINFGGTALNYTGVNRLLFNGGGLVNGVVACDQKNESKDCKSIYAKVVVNTTGPWTDEIRAFVSQNKIIRKQRGSHIIFSQERFPIQYAITLFHPDDKRSFFIIPWEGTTLVGTTDIDQNPIYESKYPEPYMSKNEEKYFLKAINFYFPDIHLSSKDIISSFSGIRPIIMSGDSDNPSKQSRKDIILHERRLVTITGGKLTTYGKMAFRLLKSIQPYLQNSSISITNDLPLLNHPQKIKYHSYLSIDRINQLQGRYGDLCQDFLSNSNPAELELIDGTNFCIAELRWAVQNEAVYHLDDLLLRRTRIGLLLAKRGLELIEILERIFIQELSWNKQKWNKEVARYKKIIKESYYLQ